MSDFSLGASWAFSFQQVLQPENRPLFHNSEEGPGLGRSHLNSAVRQSGIVLLRYGIDRSWVVAQRFIDLTVDPQFVKQHRQLSSHRNDRSFLSILSSALGQPQSPSPQITIFPERPQNVVRPLHHQGAQVAVSFLADVELGLTPTGIPAPRTLGKISSLREVLSDQPIRWCCIDRLSRQGFSECGFQPRLMGTVNLDCGTLEASTFPRQLVGTGLREILFSIQSFAEFSRGPLHIERFPTTYWPQTVAENHS
jgi:hypothetical protein